MRKKAKPGKGSRGAVPKMLTKIEPVPSFFNFFSPPQVQPQYPLDATPMHHKYPFIADD